MRYERRLEGNHPSTGSGTTNPGVPTTIAPVIEILKPSDLPRARAAGELVSRILTTMRSRATAGTNLLDIDEWTRQMLVEAGAVSCYVDYAPSFGNGPFAHYICTSVNDAVLHGRPFDHTLRDGDLLSLDLAVSLDGLVADSAISFVVGGRPDPVAAALIEATETALAAGIAAAGPGKPLGDISHAIGSVLTGAGYSVNTDFGGHGVGRVMHGDPHVPNDGKPGRGYPLRAGLVLALEPWFLQTTDELVTDPDGWTLRSVDGSRGAHSEHTIAITDDGPIVLTDRSHLG